MRAKINGKSVDVSHHPDYAEVVRLAGGNPKSVVTVTWRKPDGSGGSLTEGQSVRAVDGISFNATLTNRA